jgi:hypothetical protein
MTLLPRILDLINGKGRESLYVATIGKPAPSKLLDYYLNNMVLPRMNDLEIAPFVLFGDVIMLSQEDCLYYPAIDVEEIEFIASGLVPLPHDKFWLETKVARTDGGPPLHLMWFVWQTEGYFQAIPLSLNGDTLVVHGMIIDFDRNRDASQTLRLTDMLNQNLSKNFLLEYVLHAEFICYFLIMINSRSTTVELQQAPPKLNKARLKSGKAALRDHRAVTIIPHGLKRQSKHNESGSLRSSPKIHWRRSHIRQQANGNRVLVSRCIVGLRDDGTLPSPQTFHVVA